MRHYKKNILTGNSEGEEVIRSGEGDPVEYLGEMTKGGQKEPESMWGFGRARVSNQKVLQNEYDVSGDELIRNQNHGKIRF